MDAIILSEHKFQKKYISTISQIGRFDLYLYRFIKKHMFSEIHALKFTIHNLKAGERKQVLA